MAEHPTFKTLAPMLGIEGEPVEGKTYRADGWTLYLSPAASDYHWQDFLATAGEGHVVELQTVEGDGGKVAHLVVVSPEGGDRLTAEVMRRREATVN